MKSVICAIFAVVAFIGQAEAGTNPLYSYKAVAGRHAAGVRNMNNPVYAVSNRHASGLHAMAVSNRHASGLHAMAVSNRHATGATADRHPTGSKIVGKTTSAHPSQTMTDEKADHVKATADKVETTPKAEETDMNHQ